MQSLRRVLVLALALLPAVLAAAPHMQSLAAASDNISHIKTKSGELTVYNQKKKPLKENGLSFYVHAKPLLHFPVCSHLEGGPVLDSFREAVRRQPGKKLSKSQKELLSKCTPIANDISIIHLMVRSKKRRLNSGINDTRFDGEKALRRQLNLFLSSFSGAVTLKDRVLQQHLFTWITEMPIEVIFDAAFCKALNSEIDSPDSKFSKLKKLSDQSVYGRQVVAYLNTVEIGCNLIWDDVSFSNILQIQGDLFSDDLNRRYILLLYVHFFEKDQAIFEKMLSESRSESISKTTMIFASAIFLCSQSDLSANEKKYNNIADILIKQFKNNEIKDEKIFGMKASQGEISIDYFVNPFRSNSDDTRGRVNTDDSFDARTFWELRACEIKSAKE